MKIFETELAAIYNLAKNCNIDAEVSTIRIIELAEAQGGGFSIERKTLLISGACEWIRIGYTKNKADAEKRAKRFK